MSEALDPPASKPPTRRRPIGRILFTLAIMVGVYACVSLLNQHSIAQWKWAAALDALDQDDIVEAKRLADEAISWSPEDAQLRLYYAEMLFRSDEKQACLQKADEAIERAAEDADTLSRVGYLFARMGEHQRSMELADQVTEIAESKQTMQLHRAWNHRAYSIALAAADDQASEQRIQQGLKDINQAIELFGEEPSYIDTRGYLRLFANDIDGAQADLDQAIAEYEKQREDILGSMGPESVENPEGPALAIDKQFRQVLAVLYAHRAAIYQQQGKKDLAEKDQLRADLMGLSREKGVW